MKIFLITISILVVICVPSSLSGQKNAIDGNIRNAGSPGSAHYLALLIGIDHYAPPPGYTKATNDGRIYFPNLNGCKNDALSMYSILTSKFHVQWDYMNLLLDTAAGRNGILNAFKKMLNESKRGDIAFVYAASHGSQVRNSKSTKPDKWDESMVPSDIWKEGIRDIRDKELSKIFNEFIDKGVKLTVIFDFCHSGSISRGPNDTKDKVRWMPPSLWDAKDPSTYPIPESKGNNFLIFSACQSNEIASETKDDHGTPHGAFTNALLQALSQQSVDASASTIFSSAVAILKSNGKIQEPVIGGSDERKEETLLGIKKGLLTDFSVIPVIKRIQGNSFLLNGGFALGLYKDNELIMLGNQNDSIMLRIDKVLDPVHSIAKQIKGNPSFIKSGSQFKVVNWVSSNMPLLKIYVPESTMSESEVNKFVSTAKELRESKKVNWLDAIGKGKPDPYTSVYWKKNKCFIKTDTSAAKLITNPSPQNILQYCKQDSTLYVEIPVSRNHSDEIINKLTELKNVKIERTPGLANYVLYGKLGKNDMPAYGFRKKEVAARDSLESMPIMTDCFEFNARTNDYNILDSLQDRVLKLSKIRGWLNLKAPDATKSGFGYRLELYNIRDKGAIKNNRYRIGDQISLKMIADVDSLPASVHKSFIYVFIIDQSGSMKLLFPGPGGNDENEFPKYDSGAKLIKVVTLPKDAHHDPIVLNIGQPSGTDNYFLLACESPIQNATEVFNQKGVLNNVSRGAGDTNPLAQLLDMGNRVSRGEATPTPANWSLQRLSVKCTY